MNLSTLFILKHYSHILYLITKQLIVSSHLGPKVFQFFFFFELTAVLYQPLFNTASVNILFVLLR